MKSNYGIDRVIEPVGMVPVSAWKIDNSPALRPGEARVRLRRVHIDWDSFRQICSSCACDQSSGLMLKVSFSPFARISACEVSTFPPDACVKPYTPKKMRAIE